MSGPEGPGEPPAAERAPVEPTASSPAGSRSTTRAPLGARFWAFWSSVSVSHLGDGLGLVAVPWVATTLTASAVGVAAATGAGRLPWLVLALPMGVLVDRADRFTLMARANAARCLLLVVLGSLLLADLMSLWGLLLLAFLVGTAKVLFDTAAESAVPALVAHDDLPRANGHVRSADILANDFLGRPLGGAALGVGPGVPFLVNALATGTSVVGFVALRRAGRDLERPQTAGPRQRMWPEIREGLDVVRRDETFRLFAVISAVLAGAYSGMVGIQVLYMQRVLDVGPLGFALLLSVASVGAVLGSQLAGVLVRRFGWQRTMVACMTAMAVCFTGVGLASRLYVVGALYLATGLVVAVSGVVTVSVRQQLAPSWALGRVNATFRMLAWGISVVGMLAGGVLVSVGEQFLVEHWAVRLPYLAGGVAVAGVLALAGVRLLSLVISQDEPGGSRAQQE